MDTTPATAIHAVLSRDDCARILAGHFLPDAVVATKETSRAGEWRRGDGRSILHDCWLLCTDDRTKKKDNTTFPVAFDTVVDVGGLRLSDDGCLHDHVTKKLVCIAALTTGARGRKQGARTAARVCMLFDWFVRWRRSLGLDRTSLIRKQHFDDYVDLVRGSDILDLVPVYDRLDRLAREAADGRYELPLRRYDAQPDWTALADALGVTANSLALSKDFRVELADRLPLFRPPPAWRAAVESSGGGDGEGAAKAKSAGTIRDLLDTWDILSHLSGIGLLAHDPLTIEPFGDKSADAIASAAGRIRRRTATIPPPDLMRLFDAAAKWVLDYAPHVLKAVDIVRTDPELTVVGGDRGLRIRRSAALDADLPPGMPKLWLGWRSNHAAYDDPAIRDRLSVGEAIKHLMTACAILVGGFGARRIGEVTSLRVGCLVEEKPGLNELTMYVEKTLRDLDRIPVPALLKVVVGVLEDLTASTRAVTGKDWLFEVMRGAGGKRVLMLEFRLDRLLNGFADLNGLAPPVGQKKWELKTHQFRRGFAVCYYHGFEAASLDALSRFLWHFDPEMTRVYMNEVVAGAMGRLREEIEARVKASRAAVTDADREWLKDARKLLYDLSDRAAGFNEARCEALVHRLLRMWEGAEAPVGRGAAKLYGDLDAMVARARAAVRLGARTNDPDAVRRPLVDLLWDYAETHYLEPVPGRAAHCVCRPGDTGDLAVAECLKAKATQRAPWAAREGATGDVRPDHAFSGAYVCLSCAHCAAFSDNQAVVGRAIARTEDAVVRAATPAAKAAAAEKLAKFKAAAVAARAAVQSRS